MRRRQAGAEKVARLVVVARKTLRRANGHIGAGLDQHRVGQSVVRDSGGDLGRRPGSQLWLLFGLLRLLGLAVAIDARHRLGGVLIQDHIRLRWLGLGSLRAWDV